MKKFFKDVEELTDRQLERRERAGTVIGDFLAQAIFLLEIPMVFGVGAIFFFTPGSIALGVTCMAMAALTHFNERPIQNLYDTLSRPYRNELRHRDLERYNTPPAAAPQQEITAEKEIQVMKPLSLRKSAAAFNTTAATQLPSQPQPAPSALRPALHWF